MAINIDSYSVVYPQFQDVPSTRTIENHDNDPIHQLLSLYLNADLLEQQQKRHTKHRSNSSLYWQSNMLNQTNWLGEYRSKSVVEKNTRMNSRPSSYSETRPPSRAPAQKRHKKSVSFNETVLIISQESTVEQSTLKQQQQQQQQQQQEKNKTPTNDDNNDDDDDDNDIFVDAVDGL